MTFTHAASLASRTARAIASALSAGALQSTTRSSASPSFKLSPGMTFLSSSHQLERSTADVLLDVGWSDVPVFGEVKLARFALPEGHLDRRGVADEIEGELMVEELQAIRVARFVELDGQGFVLQAI